jgi:Lectin C-type domain
MRGPLVAVLALATGCGFSAGGGQGSPSDDASTIDTPPAGDGPPATDAAVDQMADAPTGPQCPVTYAPILSVNPLSSRYRFVGGGGVKWIDAETDCADDATVGELATHLVVLDDAFEAVAVIGGLQGGGNIQDQWLGATDLKVETMIAYVTAQATTLTLAPTMQNDNKDCIRLKNTGVTEFRTCDEVNKYVCECDGQPADPNRFPNLPDGNN